MFYEMDTKLVSATSDSVKVSRKKSKIVTDLGLNELVAKTTLSQKRKARKRAKEATLVGNAVEVVTYESRKRKQPQAKTASIEGHSSASLNMNEFDMKRARLDVFKFGIKGFGQQDKQKAKEELLISLGAKPNPKKCKNYKVLTAEIRQRKCQEKEARERDSFAASAVKVFSISTMTKNINDRKRTNVSSKSRANQDKPGAVKGMSYQTGSFRHGTLNVDKRRFRKR